MPINLFIFLSGLIAVTVIFFVCTIEPASNENLARQNKSRRRRSRTSSRLIYQHFYLPVRGLVLFIIGVAGLIATLDQLWGPVWPTKPKITLHDNITASSSILPFIIMNESVIFSMSLNIYCDVDLFYFMDADGKTGLLRDAQFNPGPIHIGRQSANNYPCRASDYVRIRGDGSMIIGFDDAQNLVTGPGVFRPPLTVLKMCLWINGSYSVIGVIRQFRSEIFQWPDAPRGHQWIEGPVTPDLPSEAWVPPGSHIGGAWALRELMNADKSRYLPGTLQCSRL
jgi:hypothetical protein